MKQPALILVTLLPFVASAAARLDPAAVVVWDEYIRNAEAKAQKRLLPGARFLWLDESESLLAKVKEGEVVAVPMSPHNPQRVPSGLIHDWLGAIFIANATLDEARTVLRDYAHYKDYFPDNVIEAKALELGELKDRSALILRSQSFFLRSALDAEYESRYFPLDAHRLFTTTKTTRIQEVEGYGTANRKVHQEGEGTGAVWKVSTMTRYLERDGGVYVEVEAIVLSRDIPAGLRWAVEPVVRRVSRSSLFTSLRQTEAAINKRMEARRSIPESKGKAFAGR